MKHLLPLLTLAAATAAAQNVTATLSIIDDSALELRYDVPPSCTSLNFFNDGIRPQEAASIRADWQPMDNCAKVDGQHIQRGAASCNSLRIRVPATTRDVDRIYPWAYPIGEGFFAHTSVYAVTPSCGAVDWKFVAQGTVVVNGVISGAQVSAPATQALIDDSPVVLLMKQSKAPVHMGPGFTEPDQRLLNEALRGTSSYLQNALPGLKLPSPYIVATVSPNAYNWRGDAANRTTIRLSFPSSPSEEVKSNIRSLIAHETSHLTQPLEWKDAWDDDITMFKEGGAEFLRWSVSAAMGWRDKAALQRDLESAFSDCIIATSGKSWKRTVNRKWGRTPYACGLAFHVIGLSARGDAQSAALAMRDYYRDAAERKVANFEQLECRAGETCKTRWLSRLGSDEPVAAIFADYAKIPGPLIRPATTWSAGVNDSMANLMMHQLMRADCNGGVSFYNVEKGFRVADGLTCKALRVDMTVTGIEGQPFSTSQRASQAAKAACDDKRQIKLNLQGGDTVNIACNAIELPSELYSVDIDLALKNLAHPNTRLRQIQQTATD
ncbi:hypothetical protein ACXZ1M_14215 [Duganella sp. PWIR1]